MILIYFNKDFEGYCYIYHLPTCWLFLMGKYSVSGKYTFAWVQNEYHFGGNGKLANRRFANQQ